MSTFKQVALSTQQSSSASLVKSDSLYSSLLSNLLCLLTETLESNFKAGILSSHIILDDLSVLWYLGVDDEQILKFIMDLEAVKKRFGKVDIRTVYFVSSASSLHSSSSTSALPSTYMAKASTSMTNPHLPANPLAFSQLRVFNTLCHLSSFIITMSDLPSGVSDDVHGVLRLIRGGSGCVGASDLNFGERVWKNREVLVRFGEGDIQFINK